MSGEIDWDEVVRVAERRKANHVRYRGDRDTFTDDEQERGLAGEASFAARYGLEWDRSDRLTGDGGIDFRTPHGTVDVKTCYTYALTTEPLLLLKRGKVPADIMVLAQWVGPRTPTPFLGWETGLRLLEAPVKDTGHTAQNHTIRARDLRLMSELDRLFGTPPEQNHRDLARVLDGHWGTCEQCGRARAIADRGTPCPCGETRVHPFKEPKVFG